MPGRERLFEQGVGALSEEELLALLLGSGSRARPVALLSAQLLFHFGGLARLRRASTSELLEVPGIGEAQACRVLAALELGRRAVVLKPPAPTRLLHPADLARGLWSRLSTLRHEEFWTLLLTVRNEQIRAVRISAGGLSQCSVLAREAFGPAVAHGAPQVAFAHNHPSGDPEPSPDDQRLELAFNEAGHTLGIRVVDHLIIAEGGLFSATHGLGPPLESEEPAPEQVPIVPRQCVG